MNTLDYVLKSILDMDKIARAKKQDAEKYRKEIYNNIENEKNNIIKDELAAARNKVDTIGEGFKKGADGRIKVISKQYDEVVAGLYKKQQENAKLWVDELYDRVIKL